MMPMKVTDRKALYHLKSSVAATSGTDMLVDNPERAPLAIVNPKLSGKFLHKIPNKYYVVVDQNILSILCCVAPLCEGVTWDC